MEVALRRRLSGVADVSISQTQQIAAVTFRSPMREFSGEAFRQAVGEADVEVLAFEADVCGVIDADGGLFSIADGNRPLVRLRGGRALSGRTVCVSGRLDERVQPYELDVVTVRAVS
jgi:hypothetical protein